MDSLLLLLEMASDGALLMNRSSGVVTYVNSSGAKLLRMRKDQIIGNLKSYGCEL